MSAGILFVYSNSTDCAAGAQCFRDPTIHHVAYGEALTGRRYKLVVLIKPPATRGSLVAEEMVKWWVDELLPLKLIPDGRVYRAYEA